MRLCKANALFCAHRSQNNSFGQQNWLKSLPAPAKRILVCMCACVCVCCCTSFQRVLGQQAVTLDNRNRSCSCKSWLAHALLFPPRSLLSSPLCAIKIYCFANWPMIVNNKNVLAALFSVFHTKWPAQLSLYWQ